MIASRHSGLSRVLALAACAALLPSCALHYRGQIEQAMRTPRVEGQARLEVVEGVPVVHLYGTNEQMAAQYGAIMKPALQAMVDYAESLVPLATRQRLSGKAGARELHLDKGMRRELHAVADASGVTYNNIVMLNLVPKIACSTLAVWGPRTPDGELIMGRNADYWGLGLERCGSLIVVRHATDATPVVLVTFLGMLGGWTGINADGVGFGNMLVFNSDSDEEPTDLFFAGESFAGTTIQLAMRQAAERAWDAESMSDALQAMPHAIPMNVMVADPREAVVIELGAGVDGAHVVRRGADGMVAASNDFLAHPSAREVPRCARLAALESAAATCDGAMTVADMEKALHDARIPSLNVQAVVLEPGAMRMHVSVNRSPASKGPYHTFDVRALLGE